MEERRAEMHGSGTAIPEIRVTKYCEGDFFGCEIFREEMSKEKKG